MKNALRISLLLAVFSLALSAHEEVDSVHLPDFSVLSRAQAILNKKVPAPVTDARHTAEKEGYHVKSKNLIDIGATGKTEKGHLHRALYVEVWHKHGHEQAHGKVDGHAHSDSEDRQVVAVVSFDHDGKVATIETLSLPAVK